MKNRKIIPAVVLILLLAGGIAGWIVYHRLYEPNVKLENRVTDYIYIPTAADFHTVVDSLEKGKIKNSNTFAWVAEKMGYTHNVKPGRYAIRH